MRRGAKWSQYIAGTQLNATCNYCFDLKQSPSLTCYFLLTVLCTNTKVSRSEIFSFRRGSSLSNLTNIFIWGFFSHYFIEELCSLISKEIKLVIPKGNHWLGGMSVSKLQDMVKESEAWHAAVLGVAKNWTWLSDWSKTKEINAEYLLEGLMLKLKL